MSRTEVDALVITICRSRTVRDQARELITEDHWHADEQGHAMIWRAACALAPSFDTVEDLPYMDLYEAAQNLVVALGNGLPEDQYKDVFGVPAAGDPDTAGGLIYHAYRGITRNDFDLQRALARLTRFLEERGLVVGLREAALAAASGTLVVNYGALLDERYELAKRYAAVASDPFATIESTLAETSLEVHTTSTGLGWLNDMTDGGLADGEIYGITAGTGYGKSTLAHQIALQMARVYQLEAAATGGKPDLCAVFSFEDPGQRIAQRGLAYAAQIKKSTLMRLKDPETDLLRTRSDYDAMLAKRACVPLETFPSEYDRFREARSWMSLNYAYVDMMKPGLGDGGVSEIGALLARKAETSGQAIGLVVIDSIDLMVSRYLMTRGVENLPSAIAFELPAIVAAVRRLIANVFNCTCLLTNQLAGDMLSKSPLAVLSHENAGLAKNWGKPLDYHWVIGKQMEDSRVALFRCSKDRRSGNEGRVALLQCDGQFGCWRDASLTHTIANGEIVSRAAAEQVQGPLKPRRAPKASHSVYDDV
jgi:hypothetical protein